MKSKMKSKIKYYFEAGLWTLNMVKNAVKKGKISESEFLEITGVEYS